MGPILTTCRVFSLLRMPSRRPRVMPATLSSFVPLIMWLSRKVVSICGQQGRGSRTFATCDTNTLRLDLKTQTAFVFPQRGSHTGLHPRRGDLASVVKRVWLVALGARKRRSWAARRHCWFCERMSNTNQSGYLPGNCRFEGTIAWFIEEDAGIWEGTPFA
jgi:hypothetical protein